MRSIVLAVFVLAACTKPNPSVCCTDEADCNAKGIPIGSRCGEGLLCRGNQCIAQPCSGSSECDSSAPYCVAESCAETCSEDSQCPGFMEAPEQQFCESGACVECRAGSSEDCTAARPVCDTGVCRACNAHAECATGVCQPNGTCALTTDVAYVNPSGSASSECTQDSPCSTIGRALAVTPPRPFLLLEEGTYASTSAISFSGRRWFIGRGATQPTLTRTTPGPIVSLTIGADATFENLQVSGATSSGADEGNAIQCDASGGSAMVRLYDITAIHNAASGASLPACNFDVRRSVFADNRSGLWTRDTPGAIDRSVFAENHGYGLELDGGVYEVTNSFIVRNYDPRTDSQINGGLYLYSTSPSNHIEFNTIVDNGNAYPGVGGGVGFQCDVFGTTGSFPNNIIVRNKQQTAGSKCSFPSSIIQDTNIGALSFKSTEAAPYDYHLTAGSIAIDAATISTIDHDVDGDARPNGDGRDVGADEFVQ